MKKLTFIFPAFIILLAIGCKKQSVDAVIQPTVNGQIIGNWIGSKHVAYYTDLTGKSQIYTYSYVFSDNITATTADKTLPNLSNPSGIPLHEFVKAVPYTILALSGNNYINFEVSAGDTEDAYQIVSLTSSKLVLNIKQSKFYADGSILLGSDATIDEEYTK